MSREWGLGRGGGGRPQSKPALPFLHLFPDGTGVSNVRVQVGPRRGVCRLMGAQGRARAEPPKPSQMTHRALVARRVKGRLPGQLPQAQGGAGQRQRPGAESGCDTGLLAPTELVNPCGAHVGFLRKPRRGPWKHWASSWALLAGSDPLPSS